MQLNEIFIKRPFLPAGIVGFFVVVTAIWMLQFFPAEAVHLPKGFSTPVIFFEFIQSPMEVADFFGITDDGIPNESFINQMNKGNYLDFFFMLVYSSFLFLFFYLLAKISGNKWVKTGMLLALFAFFGDMFENIQLLGITANLESGHFLRQLSLLHLFTWIKWGSLAISFVLFSVWLYPSGGIYRFMGYVTAIPFLLGIWAFLDRGTASELFAKSISVAFFVMICYCFLYRAKN